MEQIDLSFLFKGKRNYIHGTDIYDQVIRAVGRRHDIGELRLLRIKMRRLVHKQCHLMLGSVGEKLEVQEESPADIFVSTAEGNTYGYLVDTGCDINGRYAFDEEAIRSLCILSDGAISIRGLVKYTPIEIVVVMTKLLHQTIFPEVKGKWLFTQLELKRLFTPEDSSKLVIKFKHNFNYALTKSAIQSGTSELGHIYFSLV